MPQTLLYTVHDCCSSTHNLCPRMATPYVFWVVELPACVLVVMSQDGADAIESTPIATQLVNDELIPGGHFVPEVPGPRRKQLRPDGPSEGYYHRLR